MERLILEYHVTDGYTYGYDVHLPMIYENREKAVEDLYELLVVTKEKREELNLKIEGQRSESDKLFKKIKNTNDEAKQKEYNENWLKSYEKVRELENSYPKEIHFGGQTICLSVFDINKNIEIPTIYTLDEYFQSVENKPRLKP